MLPLPWSGFSSFSGSRIPNTLQGSWELGGRRTRTPCLLDTWESLWTGVVLKDEDS